MLSIVFDQAAVVGLAGLLVLTMVSDLRRYTIPNQVTAAMAALWLVHAVALLAAGAPVKVVLAGVVAGAMAFAAGAVLFYCAMLGGGDVKLLAAVALWAGPALFAPAVILIALAGGLLALTLLIARTMRAMATAGPERSAMAVAWPAFRATLKEPAPFGLAIATGGLFVAWNLAGPLRAAITAFI